MPGKSGAGRVFARRPSCAPNSRLARKLQNPLGRIAVTKANRGSAGYSPDRVDALVWAFTELLVERMPSYAAYEIARKRAEAVIAQRAASLKRCLWNQCNDRSPASRTRAYCEHVQQARTEIRKTDRQLGAEASGTRLQSGSA